MKLNLVHRVWSQALIQGSRSTAKCLVVVALLTLSSDLFAVTPVAPNYVIKQVDIQQMPVKTIVPITAKTAAQAIAQAKVIAANPNADLAEFRIDLLDFARDTQAVIALGQQLNLILKDKPLIATIRTANEGGRCRFPIRIMHGFIAPI